MIQAVKIFIHEGANPYHNLAIETELLQTCPANTAILYLWQNQNTVVLGRNQNAYKECKLTALVEDQVYLTRRISGGGAVYHDLGNLNYTFILPNQDFSIDYQFKVIMDALAQLGIQALKSGRNDLTIDGFKFSGNAFYHGATHSYHHGTLLVDVDFNKLACYLNVSDKKLAGNGVQSVVSRVTNLKRIQPTLTLTVLKQACVDSFLKAFPYACTVLKLSDLNQESIQQCQKKYESNQWLYNHRFIPEKELHEKYSWGEFQMLFKIQEHQILDCAIFVDALEVEVFENLNQAFIGIPYSAKSINEVFANNISDKRILADLQTLVNQKLGVNYEKI